MWTMILGGVLFFCLAYIGIGIRAYYARRKELYCDCIEYIDYLKENIGFLKTPLKELSLNFCKEKKGEWAKLLNKYIALLEKGSITSEKIDKLVSSPYIDKERQAVFSQFFSELGKVDCDTQLEQLQRVKASLIPVKDYYGKKYRTTGVLAYRLGILLGIAVMVIAA